MKVKKMTEKVKERYLKCVERFLESRRGKSYMKVG
jgi:hypothetical protein